MGEAIYKLPEVILPCTPLNTLDQQYLNFDSSPAIHPLMKSLKIDNYNTTWVSDTNKPTKPPIQSTKPPLKLTKPAQLTTLNNTHHSLPPSLPTVTELYQNLQPSEPNPTKTIPNQPPTSPLTPLQLHNSIQQSNDKLFFINYTPEHTIQPQWYLIQVDLDASSSLPSTADCMHTGTYYITFFLKHPHDKNKADSTARWWPEWHQYKRSPTDGNIEYGKIMLL